MRQHFVKTLVLAILSLLAVGSLFPQTPLDIRTELIRLKAEDGKRSKGAYYRLNGTQPKTAVLIMHPRGDNTTHFILQPLARNGLGAMGMMSRTAGHSGIHEELILDVAAGVRFLKKQGVENIILAGHSGGGSLMAFFQAQAETLPPNRIKHTPAGDPPNLNEFDLPKVQGLITLNAAEGEGIHIAHHLDPSLTDENDPFSYDPTLDPYNPDNGWRVPPQISEYTPSFVKRFRAAQQERAERLVEIAHSMVRRQNSYRDLMKSAEFEKMDLKDRLMIERKAQFQEPMLIWRTRSDVRYFGLAEDPSDRILGHYAAGFGRRSDLQNWAHERRLRSVTPRAFLSTESIVSNARMWDNLKIISIPLLIVNSTADPGVHVSEGEEAFRVAASQDKKIVWIEGGDHGYLPEGPKAGEGNQREEVIEAITDWAQKRWPW